MTTPENFQTFNEKFSETLNSVSERMPQSEFGTVETADNAANGGAEHTIAETIAADIDDAWHHAGDIDIGSVTTTSRQLEIELIGNAKNAPPAGTVGTFPAAPKVDNEFTLRLDQLQIGTHSLQNDYDFSSGRGKAILHAVLEPEKLAPIQVKKIGSNWVVVDGWARVMAMRFHFGNTANMMVRVVAWDGSEKDAIYQRFASEFLTLVTRKIDKARLLLKFHNLWNVPQIVLAARIGLQATRVTKDLKAAVAYEEAPRFIQLLDRSSDPAIDYLYQVQCAREAAMKEDANNAHRDTAQGAVAALGKRLEDLLSKPERFNTAGALIALGIKESKGLDKPSQDIDSGMEHLWSLLDFIPGPEDDEPAIKIYASPDKRLRFDFLIDPSSLDATDKAELKARLLKVIEETIG